MFDWRSLDSKVFFVFFFLSSILKNNIFFFFTSNRVDDLANALRRGNDRSGSGVPSIMQMMDTTDVDPGLFPTRFRLNKFTKPFNNIVEA